MLILLGTTITASFLDSLNPSAIAQQMLLQAMTPKKQHTLFFILGIGLANLLLGLAVYLSIAAWVTRLLSALTSAHPLPFYGAEIAAGVLLLLLGTRWIARTRRNAACAGDAQPKAPAQLTPLSLFCLGAAFCGVELTSALPYFGFLAMLAGLGPSLPLAMGYILLYNFIYIFPLLLVYAGYNRLRGTAGLQRLERGLQRISAYVVPVVLTAFAVLLLLHGTFSLF